MKQDKTKIITLGMRMRPQQKRNGNEAKKEVEWERGHMEEEWE